MLPEAHPVIRQFLRFCALPYCFFRLINWEQCSKSPWLVARDILFIFFRYRYFPDNYSPCRFYEKERSEWTYYYGSSYHPWARHNLRKRVQPMRHMGLFLDKAKSEEHFRQHDITMAHSYGVLTPGPDFPGRALEMLRRSRADRLIMKPLTGAGGRGICLLVATADGVHVQQGTALTPVAAFSIGEDYLVQEILTQDERVAGIYPRSINSVRTVTLLGTNDDVLVVSASMRFGVGDAFIDNWSAGGVAVGVVHSAGTLARYAFDKMGRRFERHPTTGFRFEGFAIPHWSGVVELSKKVQRAAPFYKLLGLDIALTAEGPKVIEVNANPDFIFQEQTAGPLLRDRGVLEEFDRYGLLFNRYQKALLAAAADGDPIPSKTFVRT